jgi:phenylacetate-CoA ligase
VTTRVPYYRARARLYDPKRPWSRVPLLTKEALRDALPFDILTDHIDIKRGLDEGWLERLETSGTSGERIRVLADPTLAGAPARDLELWQLAASERLKRVAILASPACLGPSCDGTYESRLRENGTQLILPSTDEPFLWEEDITRAIVSEIDRFDAGELFVNPVYLHALVRACAREGVSLPRAPAFIRCTYQYLSTCQRRALARAFPSTRIVSYYGASELSRATVAMECAHGRMHVWEEQCFVEIVDALGAPLPRGERGRIVVTPIASRVTPLVRYLVGDIGVLVDEPCTCPLAGSPVLVHHGREKDALHVGGRVLSARDVDTVLGDVRGLDAYQLVQRGDAFTLACVPSLDEPLSLSECAARASALIGKRVSVRAVDELDGEPSGKIAFTVRLS